MIHTLCLINKSVTPLGASKRMRVLHFIFSVGVTVYVRRVF